MNLDLVGRDPTADGVGLSTGITPATRAAVLAFVSLQLIELVRLPVTGHARGRGAHAALSTSDVRRVGHQLSTVFSGTCQEPTAREAERANSGSGCRGAARPVGSMRTAVATKAAWPLPALCSGRMGPCGAICGSDSSRAVPSRSALAMGALVERLLGFKVTRLSRVKNRV